MKKRVIERELERYMWRERVRERNKEREWGKYLDREISHCISNHQNE